MPVHEDPDLAAGNPDIRQDPVIQAFQLTDRCTPALRPLYGRTGPPDAAPNPARRTPYEADATGCAARQLPGNLPRVRTARFIQIRGITLTGHFTVTQHLCHSSRCRGHQHL
jgi:hypothetical protein